MSVATFKELIKALITFYQAFPYTLDTDLQGSYQARNNAFCLYTTLVNRLYSLHDMPTEADKQHLRAIYSALMQNIHMLHSTKQKGPYIFPPTL